MVNCTSLDLVALLKIQLCLELLCIRGMYRFLVFYFIFDVFRPHHWHRGYLEEWNLLHLISSRCIPGGERRRDEIYFIRSVQKLLTIRIGWFFMAVLIWDRFIDGKRCLKAFRASLVWYSSDSIELVVDGQDCFRRVSLYCVLIIIFVCRGQLYFVRPRCFVENPALPGATLH